MFRQTRTPRIVTATPPTPTPKVFYQIENWWRVIHLTVSLLLCPRSRRLYCINALHLPCARSFTVCQFISDLFIRLAGEQSALAVHCLRVRLSVVSNVVQGDSFVTRPKKMRISQRLFIRSWTCIYDNIPCFTRSMSILEETLEMFATTVQAELNATLHVCESGLQDVLTKRSNFTSNVVFQFLYGAWLVGISFSF